MTSLATILPKKKIKSKSRSKSKSKPKPRPVSAFAKNEASFPSSWLRTSLVSNSYATMDNRQNATDIIQRIKRDSSYTRIKVKGSGYRPRLGSSTTERQRSINGSRLKQRPGDTLASVSSTSLGLLKSHQTLPKVENKTVEAD